MLSVSSTKRCFYYSYKKPNPPKVLVSSDICNGKGCALEPWHRSMCSSSLLMLAVLLRMQRTSEVLSECVLFDMVMAMTGTQTTDTQEISKALAPAQALTER